MFGPKKVKCPFCRELIQPDAAKCRHCGEWLQTESQAGESAETQGASEPARVVDTPEQVLPSEGASVADTETSASESADEPDTASEACPADDSLTQEYASSSHSPEQTWRRGRGSWQGKLTTKIVGWLCVAIAFRPIWMTMLTGENQATGSSAEGALTTFFGVGGIGLLLHKPWGWWLVTVGMAFLVAGAVMAGSDGSYGMMLGIGSFAILALLALLADRPSHWPGGGRGGGQVKISTKVVGYLWLGLGAIAVFQHVVQSARSGELGLVVIIAGVMILFPMFGLPSIMLLQQRTSGWWAILVLSALCLPISAFYAMMPVLISSAGRPTPVAIGICMLFAGVIVTLLMDRPAHWVKHERHTDKAGGTEEPGEEAMIADLPADLPAEPPPGITAECWGRQEAMQTVDSVRVTEKVDIKSDRGRDILVRRLAGVYTGLGNQQAKLSFVKALREKKLGITGADLEQAEEEL